MTLEEAITEYQHEMNGTTWRLTGADDDKERIILNAVASGQLVPKADADLAVAEIARLRAQVNGLMEALDLAADDLNEAGRNLAELEITLSRDPWRSEHAHQCASEARAALTRKGEPK